MGYLSHSEIGGLKLLASRSMIKVNALYTLHPLRTHTDTHTHHLVLCTSMDMTTNVGLLNGCDL